MRLVGPAVLMSLFRAGIDVTARPRDESCNQSPGAGIDSFRVRPRCDFHAAGALRRRFVHWLARWVVSGTQSIRTLRNRYLYGDLSSPECLWVALEAIETSSPSNRFLQALSLRAKHGGAYISTSDLTSLGDLWADWATDPPLLPRSLWPALAITAGTHWGGTWL